MPNKYQLFVNFDRTVMVRYWADGMMEVCRRKHASHTWGAPVIVCEVDA